MLYVTVPATPEHGALQHGCSTDSRCHLITPLMSLSQCQHHPHLLAAPTGTSQNPGQPCISAHLQEAGQQAGDESQKGASHIFTWSFFPAQPTHWRRAWFVPLELCWQLCDITSGRGWLKGMGGPLLPLGRKAKCHQGKGGLCLQEGADTGRGRWDLAGGSELHLGQG